MKKTNCTVLYNSGCEGYILKAIHVKHKKENITIYYNDNNSQKYFKNLFDLYDFVLDFLKENNFYVTTWEDFGTIWYDIDFIDVYYGNINRFAYRKKVD